MKVTSLFMFVYEYALCPNAIMLMIFGIGSENNHTSVLGFWCCQDKLGSCCELPVQGRGSSSL